MPTDSEQSPREIQREMRETRDDMRRTIRAIEDTFSPEALVDRAIEYVRRGPGDFIGNLGATVRDNPVPVALAATGLVWLAASTRDRGNGHVERRPIRRAHPSPPPMPHDVAPLPADVGHATRAGSSVVGHDPGEILSRPGGTIRGAPTGGGSMSAGAAMRGHSADEGRDVGEAIDDAADSARAMAGAAAGKAKSKARAIADDVRATARSAGESVKSAAERVGDRARQAGREAWQWADETASELADDAADLRERAAAGFDDLGARASAGAAQLRDGAAERYRDNPLVFGLAALAIGAAIGAALPSTRREDALMGEASDAMARRARRQAARGLARAGHAVEAGAEAAGELADEVTDRMVDVAHRATDALTGEEASERGEASSGKDRRAKGGAKGDDTGGNGVGRVAQRGEIGPEATRGRARRGTSAEADAGGEARRSRSATAAGSTTAGSTTAGSTAAREAAGAPRSPEGERIAREADRVRAAAGTMPEGPTSEATRTAAGPKRYAGPEARAAETGLQPDRGLPGPTPARPPLRATSGAALDNRPKPAPGSRPASADKRAEAADRARRRRPTSPSAGPSGFIGTD